MNQIIKNINPPKSWDEIGLLQTITLDPKKARCYIQTKKYLITIYNN